MALTDAQAAELERLAEAKHEWELRLDDAYNLQMDIEHELYLIAQEMHDIIDSEGE